METAINKKENEMPEFQSKIDEIFMSEKNLYESTGGKYVSRADRLLNDANKTVVQTERSLDNSIIKGLSVLVDGIKKERDVNEVYIIKAMNGSTIEINVVSHRVKDKVLFEIARSLKSYTWKWLDVKIGKINNNLRTFKGDTPISTLTIYVEIKDWPAGVVDLTRLIKKFPYKKKYDFE